MTPGWAAFVMMSNYFHDVATAMLVACSAALWIFLKRCEADGDGPAGKFLEAIYGRIAKVVVFSWAWIISAGVLRAATFSSYEWAEAVDKNQTAGLLVKYGIAAFMIAAGGLSWEVLRRRVARAVRASREGSSDRPERS